MVVLIVIQQTWYERQKGAEERFDFIATGGDVVSFYGEVLIPNPFVAKIGQSISFGATTLSNMVSPGKTDAEMINGYLPWYFQLTDLNPKIEEEK